ncbi:MAG: hypothetical protein ACK4GT_15315 [Pararhodobacter sp.]
MTICHKDHRAILRKALDPLSIYDLDPARGEPGPRSRPAGKPGLAAWFARRMA